jgi:hypothetical protein
LYIGLTLMQRLATTFVANLCINVSPIYNVL